MHFRSCGIVLCCISQGKKSKALAETMGTSGGFRIPRDGVAVWHMHSPNARAGAHNFTTSQEEHMTLMRLGWLGEGIAWYAVR